MSNDTYDVHVDASRRWDITIPEGVTTAGEWADITAVENDVAGTEFSFKADGVVLDRKAKLSKLEPGTLLELVEVTVPAPDEGSADSSDTDVVEVEVEGGLVVPDGSIADVEGWVAEGSDGWRQRAQAALDVEQGKDEPRNGLVGKLTKALAADE